MMVSKLFGSPIFLKFAGQHARFLSSVEFMRNPVNEPVLGYLKGSPEKNQLEEKLGYYSSNITKIPAVIGGQDIYTDANGTQVMPFDHQKALATFSISSKEMISKAIESAMSARDAWERTSLDDRIKVFLDAADLCVGKYRQDLNAATMLGQGKTIIQAEIDSACELADFLRFNAYFAQKINNQEEWRPICTETSDNKMLYRGLEGFIASVSPFNFTAIGGNLSSCPAMMGNVVLWKPSPTAMLSNYIFFKIMQEAGLPPGIVNFIPLEDPKDFGDIVTSSPHFAALNFTGSVPTFTHLWRQIASNLGNYGNFPRMVGECGGKNFHFVHPSADISTVVPCSVRSAFEYQGQKCSACGRMYVPETLWPTIRDSLLENMAKLKLGSPLDSDTFLTAVIDEKAFKRISSYLDHAKQLEKAGKAKILAGGKTDNSKGYFVEPTLIEIYDLSDKLMTEEIFGPVLTVMPYPEKDCMPLLKSIKDATPYGLTGAVFSSDRQFLDEAQKVLRDAVGNLYLNDKSTGSVVGQQPFGGARMSGTNDKAGGPHYVLKYTSPQTIKETKAPQTQWNYPYMDQ